MTPTLDALRAAYPHLSFTVYAYVGQPVTLEAITGDGKSFTFKGGSEAEAILKGFGDDFVEPAPPTTPAEAPVSSVFD